MLIDTAGRYTTQDSDATSDKESWFSFLDLLKKSRPRQPINGVLVAISLEDILTLSAQELAAQADAIRRRLLELHERLKVDFPVYALFTKADLVAGFFEYFSYLNEQTDDRCGAQPFKPRTRKRTWSATFPPNSTCCWNASARKPWTGCRTNPLPHIVSSYSALRRKWHG